MSDDPEVDASGGSLEGRYANYFQVGHNAFEFLLDFGQLYGEVPALHTRIIANPAYVKVFLQVLIDALDAYQRTFGDIEPAAERAGDAAQGEHQ